MAPHERLAKGILTVCIACTGSLRWQDPHHRQQRPRLEAQDPKKLDPERAARHALLGSARSTDTAQSDRLGAAKTRDRAWPTSFIGPMASELMAGVRFCAQDGGLDRYLLKSPPQKLGGLGLRLRSLVIAALRTRAALSNGFSTPIDPSQLWQIPQYQTPSERVHNEQKGMSPVKQGRGEEGEEKERMRTRMVQNRWQREVEVRLVREGEEPVIDSTAAGRQPDRRSTHPHRRLQ